MKKTIFLICIVGLFAQSCTNKTNKSAKTNPLLDNFDTPFETPNFSKISDSDFIPAYSVAMKENDKEILNILSNKEKPNFFNTIEALEKSGVALDRISCIFDHLKGANTNATIDSIANVMTPQLIAHYDKINLNADLFKRIKTVYDNQDKEELTIEQKNVLKNYYNDFIRGGANLSPEDKIKFSTINKELGVLGLKFGDNKLNETNEYKLVIKDQNELKGLPEGVVAAAAECAESYKMSNCWVFTLSEPSRMGFLKYADNRELRKQIYQAYTTIGCKDNKYSNWDIISKITSLRVQKAHLLAYKNHASYVLADNMAKNPENVYKLCNKIWDAALPVAKKEVKELQNMIYKEGAKFKLQGWDWFYYAEKLKKAKYDLDENEISQYLPLDSVRKGAFMVAHKLYGITFEKRDDISVANSEAQAYEVKDADGKHIGIYYTDYFPRSNKRSGAWMSSLRKQSYLLKATPLITNTTNFTRPTKNTPSLLTVDEARTLFHEFGHALQGLLSKCTYTSISGTAVARDIVELPSQIMENWAVEPQVLKMYARNWKTGEVIPDKLIKKMQNAALFNKGFEVVEFMSAALLDMAYHTTENVESIDAKEFETNYLNKIGLIPEITVRYRGPYFSHIFNGGYSSGYYAYTWAEVLDADAFNAFKESGDIFNPELAKKFKDNILSKGGSEDPMKLYINFRGQEPSIEPLLTRKGLK